LNIENRKILVLGGYGLVGTAVCRELLSRRPREIQIHSLRIEESQKAVEELRGEAGSTVLSVSSGNIFGLPHSSTCKFIGIGPHSPADSPAPLFDRTPARSQQPLVANERTSVQDAGAYGFKLLWEKSALSLHPPIVCPDIVGWRR
jgi:hypothetical protein